MRLRPKQAFCIKCKKKLIEDKEFISHDEINFKACKRKICEEMEDAANPKRLKENSENTIMPRSSPVIKISYSSPKGGDTVMKILPRPDNAENGLDLLPQFESANGLNHKQYRKLKRALKEARMKAKQAKLCSTSQPIVKRKHKEMNVYARNARKSLNTAVNFHKSKVNWQPRVVLSKNFNRRKVKSPTILQTMLESKSDLKSKELVRDSHTRDKRQLKSGQDIELIPGEQVREDASCSKFQQPKKNCQVSNGPDSDESAPLNNGNCHQNAPPGDSSGLLKMRIQTQTIDKVQLEDGRVFQSGSIAWGKIQGFPWWPCRVGTLTRSIKNCGDVISQTAHVSWFGASTFSQIECSELRPFLEDFKARHNKKKKGSYRSAVRNALQEAKRLSAVEECEMDHQALEV